MREEITRAVLDLHFLKASLQEYLTAISLRTEKVDLLGM
jgi:hypothetical protein